MAAVQCFARSQPAHNSCLLSGVMLMLCQPYMQQQHCAGSLCVVTHSALNHGQQHDSHRLHYGCSKRLNFPCCCSCSTAKGKQCLHPCPSTTSTYPPAGQLRPPATPAWTPQLWAVTLSETIETAMMKQDPIRNVFVETMQGALGGPWVHHQASSRCHPCSSSLECLLGWCLSGPSFLVIQPLQEHSSLRVCIQMVNSDHCKSCAAWLLFSCGWVTRL